MGAMTEPVRGGAWRLEGVTGYLSGDSDGVGDNGDVRRSLRRVMGGVAAARRRWWDYSSAADASDNR